jgi:hypothetical protein
MCMAIALTCWICTFIALPRKPLPGNEVEELVYARLLGRQQRLALVAVFASGVAFLGAIIAVSQQPGADAALPTEQACWIAPQSDQPVCGPWQPLATQGVQPVQSQSFAAVSTGPICTSAPATRPRCYTSQPLGDWLVAELQADGKWRFLGTQMRPPSPAEQEVGGNG